MATVYFAMFCAALIVFAFVVFVIYDLCTPEYYVPSKKEMELQLQKEKNTREAALEESRNAQLILDMRACQE